MAHIRSNNIDSCDDYEIDNILKEADAANIKLNLNELVQKYIRFFNKENMYIVVKIDDADLNISNTYSFVEELRKYLILPRVIVLVSANLAQLENSIEQEFILQYKTSIQFGGLANISQCHLASANYIKKVFPVDVQVKIPDINESIFHNFKDLEIDYVLNKSKGSRDCKKGPVVTGKYDKAILEFLNKKTGIQLIHEEEYLHNLVPSKMRELTNFLAFFNEMEDISLDFLDKDKSHACSEEDEKSYSKWITNLEKFEQYIIEGWAPTNLTEKERYFIRELSQTVQTLKFQKIIEYIPKHFIEDNIGKIYSYDECVDMWNESLRRTNNSVIGYTLPNVERHLYSLTKTKNGDVYYKFVYGIRLYLSVYLTKIVLAKIFMQKEIAAKRADDADSMVTNILRSSSLSNNTGDLTYGRFEVNAKHLCGVINNRKKYLFGLEQAYLKWFCRKYDTDNDIARIIEIEDNKLCIQNEDRVVFDSSYYLLYLMENDVLKSDASRLVIGTNKELLEIMNVFLNCDIKKSVLKRIKNSERDFKKSSEMTLLANKTENRYFSIADALGDIMSRVATGGTSDKAEHKNYYDKLKLFTKDKGSEGEVSKIEYEFIMLAIQMSNQHLAHKLLLDLYAITKEYLKFSPVNEAELLLINYAEWMNYSEADSVIWKLLQLYFEKDSEYKQEDRLETLFAEGQSRIDLHNSLKEIVAHVYKNYYNTDEFKCGFDEIDFENDSCVIS